MKPDLFWIPAPSGKLAIAARPRGGDWLADELPALAQEVDVLVSLLRPDEEAELGLGGERRVAEKAGIEFIAHPVPDRGLPEDEKSILAVARLLATRLDDDKRVAMHCRMGLGRSALLAAATLAVQGIRVDEAFLRIRTARGFEVPDTPAQRRFVEEHFDTTTLFRPVGPVELDLIRATGFRAFPPRLASQPIFYPVLTEAYATQIARDWNVKESGAGHVTRFQIRREFLDPYGIQTVGSSAHQEYWIPAEDLPSFNENIAGRIEIVASFP